MVEYVETASARQHEGYVAVEDGTVWFFSPAELESAYRHACTCAGPRARSLCCCKGMFSVTQPERGGQNAGAGDSLCLYRTRSIAAEHVRFSFRCCRTHQLGSVVRSLHSRLVWNGQLGPICQRQGRERAEVKLEQA